MVLRVSSETIAPMCCCAPMHPRVPDFYRYKKEESGVVKSLIHLMVFEIDTCGVPPEIGCMDADFLHAGIGCGYLTRLFSG